MLQCISYTGVKGSHSANKKIKFWIQQKRKGPTEGTSGLVHRTVRCATGHVRCTRGLQRKLATFGNFLRRLRYNSPNCLLCQRSNGSTAPTVVCNGTVKVNSARLRAQKSEQRQKAHQTVNSDCPVHHRTVRWPTCQKLQRSEPNGRVTWLAHRTVSGAPCDRSLHKRLVWWLGL